MSLVSQLVTPLLSSNSSCKPIIYSYPSLHTPLKSHPSSVRAFGILPSSAVFHFDSDCIWSESLWMPRLLYVQSNQSAKRWTLSHLCQFLVIVIHIYSPQSSYALDAVDILHMNFESDGIIYCHICDSLWLLWFYRTKQVFVFKKYGFDDFARSRFVIHDIGIFRIICPTFPNQNIDIWWFRFIVYSVVHGCHYLIFRACLQLQRLVQLLIK